MSRRRAPLALLLPLLALPSAARAAWSAPQAVGRTNWPSLAVATGGRGDDAFAWLVDLSPHRTLSERTVIRARVRTSGGRLGPLQTVSPRGLAHGPAIAVNRRGDALAAWSQARTGGHGVRVLVASRRHGHRFGPARALGPGQALFAATPRLAMNARGDAVLAWRATGTSLLVAYRRAGHGFGRPQRLVSPPAADQLQIRDPAVAIDASGNAYVAWVSAPRAERNQPLRGANGVRFAQRSRTGRFGRPRIVSGPDPAFEPSLAVGRDHTVVLVWRAGDSSGGNPIRASIRPPGGVFGSPQQLSAPLFAVPGQTPESTAHAPLVARTPGGETVAAWAETAYTRALGDYQQVGVATAPAGGAFGPPAVLTATGQSSGDPALAVDDRGRIGAVWQEAGRIRAAVRPPGGIFGPAQAISARVPGAGVPTIAGGRTLLASWVRSGRVESATWSTP
jgi:hypothetical protein